MPKPKLLPSVAYLRQCFTYNRRTGVLTWKRRPQSHYANIAMWKRAITRWSGTPAGWFDEGYIRVRIDGVVYDAHRIIWKMMTGEEPTETIDHRNGNPGDNRWSELRPATRAQQSANKRLYRNNTSGYAGVHEQDKRWVVTVNGQYIGTFRSKAEAITIRKHTARKIQGEFHREHSLPLCAEE